MSSLIDWGQTGPYYLVVAGDNAIAFSVASPANAIQHEYVSLPQISEWDSFGSPLSPLVQTYESFPPITGWDISGHTLPEHDLPRDDAGNKYEAGPGRVISWDVTGQATASSPPENLDIGTTPTLTLSGLLPVIAENDLIDVPYGINESIIGFAPTLLEGSDFGINFSIIFPIITIFGFVPELVEFSLTDEQLLVPTATITISGFSPDFVDSVDLDVAASPTLLIFADYPTVSEQGLLPPVLSYSDAKMLWETLLFDGYSPKDLLKIIAAAAAGKSTGALDEKRSGTIVFKSADGLRDTITCKYDGIGNRIEITLTP